MNDITRRTVTKYLINQESDVCSENGSPNREEIKKIKNKKIDKNFTIPIAIRVQL
jgi:hypothetical protein